MAGVGRYRIKKRWITLFWLAVVSMLLIAIASLAMSIYIYGNSSSKIVRADAAIVLGAAAWGNQPSPVFRERINHGINLYKNRMIERLIFTGGQGDSKELAEAIVAKRYAIAQGVTASDILTETQSRTTQQNLYYAHQVVLAHQLNRVLIVSDPLHLKRAVLMARNLGMDAYPSPTPTTRYRSLKSQVSFLSRETYFYIVYKLFGI